MSDWQRVAALEDLRDGKGIRVSAADATVLLVGSGEGVFAVGNRCTHQGAPLDRGRVKVGGSLATVTCPAHGSVFDLSDGRVGVRRPGPSSPTRPASSTQR